MSRALRFVPAVAWAGVIFFLSAQPRLPEAPFAWPGLDKLAHAAAYALLCLLLLAADRPRTARRVWGFVALAIVYGATDELHQSVVPARSADGWDLLADAGGAALCGAIWLRGVVRPAVARATGGER